MFPKGHWFSYNIIRKTIFKFTQKHILQNLFAGLSDDSPATQMLIIYEKSLELEAQDEITEDDIDEFADCGLSWTLEKHLREAYVKDSTKLGLEEVKADYRKQVEVSQEFKRFREAIARKLTGYGRK